MGKYFRQLFGDLQMGGSMSGATQYPSKPFWTAVLTEDEDLIREYILSCYKANYDTGAERFQRMRLNFCLYAGLQYFPEDVRVVAQEGTSPVLIGGSPKLTSNHVQRLVNEQVTSVLINPTDVAVVPFGTDWQNTIQSDVVKGLLDCIDQEINQKRNREILHRRARICGEAYRKIFWNKDKGPLDPVYEKRKAAGKKVMIEASNGELKEFRRAIYQGDVDEELPFPWDVGLDPKTCPDEVNWCFIRKFVPTDELKADHPEIAENILPTSWAAHFTTEFMQTDPLRDHTLVIEFYARSTPYLPDGAYYKVTPDVVLESGPNPLPWFTSSQFGNLPIERITDMDIDGYLWGWSRIQNIAQLQNQHDNTLSLRGRNIFLSAHPKWVMPKGACNINRLANQVTVVQYAGQTAPQLVTYSSVPPDVVQYQDMVKAEMDATYGSNPIMRGEPPPGVEANAALQFLDARAQESNTLPQAKSDQFEIDTYAKRLCVISANYTAEDKRTYRAVGDDQRWQVQFFDVKTLRGKYEVRLNISSDLPKRKDALMQTVFQMSQIWPGLFPGEAVAEMFRLGHAQKFISAGACSWQAAEKENYLASQSAEVPEPQAYEDLIVHWKSHWKQMTHPQYQEWPEKAKRELFEHLLTTEYLMLVKSRTNMIFAAKLQELIVYPLVLPLPPDMAGPQPSPGLPASAIGGEGESQEDQQQATSAPQKAANAGLNQQRFSNGQFGTSVQPVM